MSARSGYLVAVLGLCMVGCFQPSRKLVLPPLPVEAKPAPQPEIEVPPDIETAVPRIDIPEVTLESLAPAETPAAKPVPRRRPIPAAGNPASSPVSQPPVTPEIETPATPPVPTAPQLSEILTDDRRRQYEAEFAGHVSRARDAVTRATRRRLTARQQETMQRIRTFLQQAEESKVKDVVTALQLARRADLLGQDLLGSLR
jgi:hypothetical protein